MSPNDVEPAQQLINHLRIDANSVGCFGDLWAILALQSKLDPRPFDAANFPEPVSDLLARLGKTLNRESVLFHRVQTMLAQERERYLMGAR